MAGQLHRGCQLSRESCSERREAVPTLRSLHHPPAAGMDRTGLTALELIETGWQDSGGCHHLEEQLMAGEGGGEGTLGMKGNANA